MQKKNNIKIYFLKKVVKKKNVNFTNKHNSTSSTNVFKELQSFKNTWTHLRIHIHIHQQFSLFKLTFSLNLSIKNKFFNLNRINLT